MSETPQDPWKGVEESATSFGSGRFYLARHVDAARAATEARHQQEIACRAVGPTVMCNLCPTGPRRSVQPPATPQEPDEAAYQRVPRCLLDATGQTIDALRAENAKLKADLDEMRRASAPLAVWQDIETAPKDGRYVWLYSPHFRKYFTAAGNILPGRWDATVGRWSVPHWGHIDVAPTHFQPLPSPPTPGGK